MNTVWPIRLSFHNAPNVTHNRLGHSKKHRSHSSQTVFGISSSSTLARKNAPMPMRSSLEHAPNVTRHKSEHSKKQFSHSSQTLSGMYSSSTLVLQNAPTSILSSFDDTQASHENTFNYTIILTSSTVVTENAPAPIRFSFDQPRSPRSVAVYTTKHLSLTSSTQHVTHTNRTTPLKSLEEAHRLPFVKVPTQCKATALHPSLKPEIPLNNAFTA